MLKLTKVDDNTYTVAAGDYSLTFDKERFEDLYFAVPPKGQGRMNNTGFYRLLVDNVCKSDADRDALAKMFEVSGEKNPALDNLQDQIQEMPKP
jgi:hypothetical protein